MPHSHACASSLFRPLAGSLPALPMKLAMTGWVLAMILFVGAGTAAAGPAGMTESQTASATPAPPPVEAGIAAAEAGQLARAIAILSPHAGRGDMTANYVLGLIYMRSGGDDAGAAALSHEHFTRAARAGHVAAVFETAFQFERGIGTKPDLELALRLYRMAARNNHLNAQYNLAVLLSNGDAVDPDLPQAYFWAMAARHNAVRSPNPVLTAERVHDLARMIRNRIPHQQAARALTAAVRLTGQPV